jgi:hypothetical protein
MRFERSQAHPYTVITPETPLEALEEFLKTEIFALGQSTPHLKSVKLVHSMRLVTDYDRKFVLAVATRQDLEVWICHTAVHKHLNLNQNFVSRRGS